MSDSDPPLPSPIDIPTVDSVRRIAALDDPVIRNLQITQCYYELSAALAHFLPRGANWCTYATWASRQAGQSIRREDLRRALDRLIHRSDEVDEAVAGLEAAAAVARGDNTESLAGAAAALKDALSPIAAFDRVSEAVATGNRKVFAEIGLEFARFLALFTEDQPTTAAVAEFCAGLQDGDPPGGQRYLRQAFTHYHRALTADDDKDRAELLFLANLEIGYHEQTRLQPEIRAAMDAPIYDPATLRRELLRELFPDVRSRLRLAVLSLSHKADALLAARDRLATEAQRLGRVVITEHLMTLELSPGRQLWLGRDLTGEFPTVLQTIINPDLRVLLARVDLTPDSPVGSAPADWSELPDRIHYITDMFRTYQLDRDLFAAPFTAEQTATLKAGQRPHWL